MRRAGLALCVVLGGGACFTLLGACSRKSTPEPVSTTTVTAADTPSESETNASSFIDPHPALTREVEVAIAADPLLSMAAKNVEVTVQDGTATLRGSVVDKEYKQGLTEVVSEVPGISRVRNDVEVSIARDADDQESDDRIAFALQRSLTSLPNVGDDAERVTVDVRHGRVVLRGETKFVTTREAVERIAEWTPGVVAVTNELTVGDVMELP